MSALIHFEAFVSATDSLSAGRPFCARYVLIVLQKARSSGSSTGSAAWAAATGRARRQSRTVASERRVMPGSSPRHRPHAPPPGDVWTIVQIGSRARSYERPATPVNRSGSCGKRPPAMRTSVRMPYIELHAHTAYSFLDGSSQPEELVAAALRHGHWTLALSAH